MANRLSQETSPYLQQHADNPVDWYPWNAEALALAQQTNKPILLSIGYSACHWCHVMAHESFEDEATAALMNELFVNIKVDREERPDLDKIYQSAHQLIAQRSGGWPLTMFLDPKDQQPFFGGTYFPSQGRYGLPAFKDVLQQISQAYQQRPADIAKNTQAIGQALQRMSASRAPVEGELDDSLLTEARDQLLESLDTEFGGFGGAPKFPHLTDIDLLLRYQAKHADQAALHAALLSLRKMALGGIHDHLGGGFCRYSVDELWMIPHFEKMLYDNGPFLSMYSQAWLITADPLFKRAATGIATWTLREMQSPEGGFYSSLDADSEGEEGKYYVWTPEQVQAVLSEDEYPLFARAYGLNRPPNFEEKHWHLHAYYDDADLAEHFQISETEVEQNLAQAAQRLFAVREQRVRPGCDEKILTSWNALMIKGLAEGGRILQQAEWIDAAQRAVDFIRQTLWVDGRLLATYKDGKAHLNAYLDDYALLLDALLSLLQARWRKADMDFAIELADALLTHFQDKEFGGFYFTAADHENLIQRPKPFSDDAMPAGNGVAAQALGRLGHVLGEQAYLDAAEQTLRAAWRAAKSLSYAHASLLIALQEYVETGEWVILRGPEEDLQAWQQCAQKTYAPQRLCLSIPDTEQDLPGFLADRKADPERCVAYVCSGTQCLPPIRDWLALCRQCS